LLKIVDLGYEGMRRACRYCCKKKYSKQIKTSNGI